MQITLKRNREESLLRHHPWIYSGALKETPELSAGQTVDVVSSQGKWIARGSYSPHSQIRVRVWTFDEGENITAEFFRGRLQNAILSRKRLASQNTTAYRLVNSESDGLPGLIVDKFNDFLVCQFLSAGVDAWKPVIIEQLALLTQAQGIYERSESHVRQKEGLDPAEGLLWGEEPPELIDIAENELRFLVDIRHGHKTGFYLDQRENRELIRHYASEKSILNCFAYSGAFGVYALKAGAKSLINLETSEPALELANKNLKLNGLDAGKVENINGDVFHVLRSFRDSNRQFDLVVLDPPKFAESENQLQKASRGYKDINLLAIKLLNADGILFTFSCSGHLKLPLFQKIVADAALDAGRSVCILKYLSQASDHPVALNFPESHYLKGLVCQVR